MVLLIFYNAGPQDCICLLQCSCVLKQQRLGWLSHCRDFSVFHKICFFLTACYSGNQSFESLCMSDPFKRCFKDLSKAFKLKVSQHRSQNSTTAVLELTSFVKKYTRVAFTFNNYNGSIVESVENLIQRPFVVTSNFVIAEKFPLSDR